MPRPSRNEPEHQRTNLKMIAIRTLARITIIGSTVFLLAGTIGFCFQVGAGKMSSPLILTCEVIMVAGLLGFLIGKVLEGRSK
jgi:hypothetical protein